RIHVFRSAAKGTYHLSPEPYPSEYENTYPEISNEEFEKFSQIALGVHEKAPNF
ncbi:MAG: KamA family radical SAM protein, partial [Leptospiraceae bacterium]|nr:KamA family radical SAM protein [Leptospiraceae bacterium]